MLLRLLGVLAIVAIQELSNEAIQKITKWLEKHGQGNKKNPLN